MCNQSGYDWVSEERGERKGGGVGIMIKQGLRWEKLKRAYCGSEWRASTGSEPFISHHEVGS